MMMDTFAMSFYVKNLSSTGSNGDASSEIGDNSEKVENGNAVGSRNGRGHGHGHGHGQVIALVLGNKESLLLEKRVIAQVLELGIVVHSVVIGLSMGASDNYCIIRPLIAAMCFHQLFEGMGLGGCFTCMAEYGFKMKAILAFFFSMTTPAGIIMGILMQQVYKENSPTALIVVGVLNAVSAGLLIYMALVDLLAAEFKGPKLQKNIKLQSFCYVVALMGTGLMSLMAKWA
ncbi:Fe(2+) transport protein 1 [Ancistrocladus abbreviatus]